MRSRGLWAFLLIGLIAPSTGTGARVACDADAVRAVEGCPASGSCTIWGDIICDSSCGTECSYDFDQAGWGGLVLVGSVRSTGPVMRFKAGRIELYPRTFTPGIETVEGGYIRVETPRIELSRPVYAPGGTIEVIGNVYDAVDALRFKGARLDVSSGSAGGTIWIDGGLHEVSLLARGKGGAPGGTILINPWYQVYLNPSEYWRVHRIDASGATGGTIRLGQIDAAGNILAHGTRGAGGSIEIDATTTGSLPSVHLGSCNYEGKKPGRIRVDGRTEGGSLIVRTGPSSKIDICQKISAKGRLGGGSVILEGGGSVNVGKILARGGRSGPGGSVRLYGVTSTAVRNLVDVRGSPGGSVEVVSNDGATSWSDIRADSLKSDAAAGTIYIGEVNDPPNDDTCPAGFQGALSARSLLGSGGSVVIRGCYVGKVSYGSIEVSGTDAEILVQGRHEVSLSGYQNELTLSALGPGASINVEYGSVYQPSQSAVPDPVVTQYANPDCGCFMSLADCRTPP